MTALTSLSNDDLDERVSLLRGFPLFKELDDAELKLIAARMEPQTLKAQTQLLQQNEDAEAVYFLAQGAVKILINGEMVAQVDTVQCFGEMSCLVPGTPASATVITATESHVFKVGKQDFVDAVNRVPRLWKTIFFQMNGRFKAVNMRLSEVLEHTPQGLVKVDRKGVITNEYSIQCTHYFGKDNLAGIGFAQLIHPDKQEAQELWASTYPMLFEEGGSLTFQDIAELLDRELAFRLEDGTVKEFVFSYYPCRSIAGAIEAIDIGIEDVTEARALERKNSEMLAEQAAMGRIYDNPESFLNLKRFIVQTLHASISYLKGFRSGEVTMESEETRDYLRQLHSLKGYAGVFALKPVQGATHHLEELLKAAKQAGTVTDELLQDLVKGVVELKETYVYTEAMFNRIGESLRKRLLGVAFTQEEFVQLKDAAGRGDSEDILRIVQAAEKIDSHKLVASWPVEAAKIAEALGKEVEVTLEGDGGPLPKRVFEDLDSVLVHFLRNSVGHGIETPEQRQEACKPGVGNIRILVDADESELRFEIQDDGRGIDFEEIAEQAECDERLDQAAVRKFVENNEHWRILFLSGFTTATEVTELSGRGIGLNAVKTLVDNYGGTIHVETLLGQGTTFKVRIPLKDS